MFYPSIRTGQGTSCPTGKSSTVLRGCSLSKALWFLHYEEGHHHELEYKKQNEHKLSDHGDDPGGLQAGDGFTIQKIMMMRTVMKIRRSS